MEALSVGIGAWENLGRLAFRAEVISVSKRSFYCQAQDGLICVGDRSIGQGPINVLLEDSAWRALRRRVMSGGYVDFNKARICDEKSVLLLEDRIYAERISPTLNIDLECMDFASLWSFMSTFGKGPMLYITNFNVTGACDPLERVIAQRGKRGLDLLRASWGQGDWQSCASEAVKTLLGLGPGLTPSGDDLLVGYMSGLELIATKNSRARDIKKILQSVMLSCLAMTNEISQAHIKWACAGYYMEPLTILLTEIAEGRKGNIYTTIKKLLVRGASSGTDTTMGLLWALENGKEMQVGGYSLAN
ncbi:DUF2877 domain-containing protein [Moorella sp. Hama-1]|uniref:DUF2877 domain-containing protein n=1 Tax=Moorella sp. Hama-1 TaxID=2138101 RepID=UPI000D64E454|nr:DUF2877 domain-containing protein [Moorella sp. Hama-1]BCV22684.1 hypothetical protein hamaS1_27530 [Moorella sp. Hama-1]